MVEQRKFHENRKAIANEGEPEESGLVSPTQAGDADCDQADGITFESVFRDTQIALPSQYRPVLDAKVSEEARNYVLSSLRSAEQKAMFFLALLAAILGFVITHTSRARWFTDGYQMSFQDFLLILSVFGLGVAAGFMFMVLYRGMQDTDRGLMFLNAMTEPDKTVGGADGSADNPFVYFTQLLQEDFYQLSSKYEKTSWALRNGYWIGSIAAILSLLLLLFSKAQHMSQHLSAPIL